MAVQTFTLANLGGITNVGKPAGNAYAVATGGTFLIDGSTAQTTVTLPALVSGNPNQVTIKRTDTSLLVMTIKPASASTKIDGALQVTLFKAFGALRFEDDGSNWFITATF